MCPPHPQHPGCWAALDLRAETETWTHTSQGGALGSVEGKMAPSSHAAHLSSGLGHWLVEGHTFFHLIHLEQSLSSSVAPSGGACSSLLLGGLEISVLAGY